MHRGDTVALRLPYATFTGRVRAVGDDIVAINVMEQSRVDLRVDPHTPIVVRVLERARAGGTRGDAVSTFRARLFELEMDERDVEVGANGGHEIVCGRLQVGHDHVIGHEPDGSSTVIAWAAVAWVRPVPE
jgi:hypothetical protein